MISGSVQRPWLKRAGIFLFHCFAATVATTFVTMLLGAAVESLIGQRIGDLIFGGPLFFAFLILGFLSGFWINGMLNSKSAQWVWIVGLGALSIFLQDQIRTPGPQGVVHDIWVEYFGNSNCGGTECLYELFGTWPLFSSIGYSIGSLAGRKPDAHSPSELKA